MDNVCFFMPEVKEYLSIQILNFVLENKISLYASEKIESVYKINLIVEGTGVLNYNSKKYPVKKGDLFFTFPSTHFYFEDTKDFSFMYIGFLGRKGNLMLDKLKISNNNFLFSNYNYLIDFWQNGLNINNQVSDWMAESILLYSFSQLANNIILPSNQKNCSDIIKKCKKYIDDNFYDCSLSLFSVAKTFFYNPKYISSAFKKQIKVGINEYITTIRIQHAVSLLNSGISNINEIAFSCGFIDSHYFSKVFKKHMGLSPSDYLKTNFLTAKK